MENSSHLTILLIDENPRTRWEVIAALLSVGFSSNVIMVNAERPARDALASEEKFDLIIADPFAYLGHGVEMMAEMRNHPIGKHIPMLVYSSCRKKSWDGAACVPKPAHGALLAGAILRCLPRGRLEVISPPAARAIALSSYSS
jgi:CheY-like chemotaxis protein